MSIDPVQMSVSPEPTDAELAAIIAAYRETWPRPSAAEPPKQEVLLGEIRDLLAKK